MNVAVIKFGRVSQKLVRSLSKGIRIVAIADPDISHLAAAQYFYPEARISTDFSVAIQERDVEAVYITIPDQSSGIALTAIAFGKKIMTAVPLEDRLVQLAKRSGISIEVIA